MDIDTDGEFRPVIRVKEGGEEISAAQESRFERLIEEGRKLLQEEMDYEGAIKKFKEAEAVAVTRARKADVCFYLSLAYYATLEEKGSIEFIKTIRKLIEIDYYRELDKLFCPPGYIELFKEIKKEYGVLKVQSRPAGADVYVNDRKAPVGRTPLTIGLKAGPVKIKVKMGNREKKEILRVIAGKETTSPVIILKGKSNLLFIIGGIVLAGGGAAVFLLKKKGENGSGGQAKGTIQVNSTPTGAKVFLDDIDTNEITNCTLTNIYPGDYLLRLEKVGYQIYLENVTVTAGQTTTVNANLAELDYNFIDEWGSQGIGDGQFGDPDGIAIDGAGNVYVADRTNHRIQKFASNGVYLAKLGSEGSGDGRFNEPTDAAIDGAGFLYVIDEENHRVQKFTSTWEFVTKWGSQGDGNGQFEYPHGIAIDGAGNVYVADTYNYRIQKFTSDGTYVTKWGSYGNGDGQFDNPYGIAVDGAGNVYVADTLNNRIQKFTSSGTFVSKWGSEGVADGQFDNPYGVAVDGAGNVYVADSGNNRIQKFTSEGTYITKWGSNGDGIGQFNEPDGIAIDEAGNVYVADTWNYRVQKFGPVSAPGKTVEMTNSPFNKHLIIKRIYNQRLNLLRSPLINRLKAKQKMFRKKEKENVKRKVGL